MDILYPINIYIWMIGIQKYFILMYNFKQITIYLLIIGNFLEIQAQDIILPPRPFVLNGTIKNLPSSGKIALGPILENPNLLQLDSQWVAINQGYFQFSGIVTDTTPVFIHLALDKGSGISTDIFFIDRGLMHIDLDYHKMRLEIPNITGGKSNSYFKKLFKCAFVRNKNKIDSITDIMQRLDDIYKGDTLRMEFSKMRSQMAKANKEFKEEIFRISKAHTGSLLPLYVLYHNYHDEFEDFAEWLLEFSSNDYLSKSIIFTALNNKVTKRNVISDGSKFPEFVFQFLDDKLQHIRSSQLLSNKYILLEFWFAKCGACIRQFNTFKDIHEANKTFRDSLSFVMVSIDNIALAYEANEISKNYPGSWMSLWDVDGKISNQLDIYSFPTNILLNKDGFVIKSNIEPYELLEILKKN